MTPEKRLQMVEPSELANFIDKDVLILCSKETKESFLKKR